MSDPCENWESIPGPNVMVWESRAGWNVQPFTHIVFRYICLIKTGFFRRVIVFVSATIFNIQIFPTFWVQCICMYTNLPHRRLLKAAIIHVRRFFAYVCAYLRMFGFAHLGIWRFIYMLAPVLGTKLTTQLQKKHEFFKTGIVLLKWLKLKPIRCVDVARRKDCECLATSGWCINTSSKMLLSDLMKICVK